jgi:hypothetical protein
LGKIALRGERQGKIGVNSIEIQHPGVLKKAQALHVGVGKSRAARGRRRSRVWAVDGWLTCLKTLFGHAAECLSIGHHGLRKNGKGQNQSHKDKLFASFHVAKNSLFVVVERVMGTSFMHVGHIYIHI